jgi:RNA polymerase sigma factor (sigma-70 family)
MRTDRTGIDRRHIHRLVAKGSDPGATDRDLLRRFDEHRDEAAFEALVNRHAAMVLAAARRVLGHTHDAEDVCQAAFLLLAKKAHSAGWQPSVANWLHKTAHFLALKARTAAARRSRREGSAAAPPAPGPLAEITGRELLAVLDEELLALPESLRGPLVLCYLEGATRDEAAERLGYPLSTLKKRLERGRDRLHDALTRRGLGLSAALLGTLLVGRAAAASAELVGNTVRAASALAAGKADGVISPRVGQLVNGGIGMTGWSKVKAVLGLLLVGGLVSAAGATVYGTADDKPPAKPATSAAKAEPPAEQTRSLSVVVLDPQGKPLAGAKVHVSVWSNEKDYKARNDAETDAAGVARVELPKSYHLVRVWAGKKPFVGMWAGWEQAELAAGKGLPAEYTFRLETATTAGGRVLDENGKPIVGAKVQVSVGNDPKPAHSDGRARYNSWLATGGDAVTTDAEGRWKVTNVPDHPGVELSLMVSHPDYVNGDWFSRPGELPGVTARTLRDGTAAVTLKAGVIVRGRVTGPDGKPIKDAIVIHGDDPYEGRSQKKFATDADGRFRLPALAEGPRSITVLAPGFAPQLRKVDLKPGLPDQDFRMAAGKPVRLRIVDGQGMPVSPASVWLHEWKGSKSVYTDHNPNHPKVPDTGIPRRADAGGVWEWLAAPDEPVKVHVHAPGFKSLDLEVTGGSTDRTVTLKAEHRITGTVTDAVTGKPVPAFTVVPVDVFGKDFLHAERYNAFAGQDGRLNFLASRTDIPLRLRIEAPGYRSQNGPEFRVGDGARRQDFRLQPSPPRTGVVVDAAGKPVAKAEVLLATPTEQARTTDGDNHRAFTDADGRFEFPDPGEPWAVIARTDAGVAAAEFAADRADSGTLTLRAWGSVRGRFQDGGKPVGGATVFLRPIRLDDPGRPRVDDLLRAVTDADGRFEFGRVPPGPVCVRVSLGPWRDEGFRSGPAVPLDLKPGGRTELDLGSGGATLTGRVKLTGKLPAGLDCTYSLNHLVRREPGIAPPAEVAAAGFDVTTGWRDAWGETREGLAYLATLRSWFVKLAADGSFRVSGVPPGEYDLAVAVYAKPAGCLTDPLARRVVRVTVTAEDAARGELRVPEVAAEVVPIPAVGDTPALTFKTTDGKDATLADYRGKHTVLHFWASWCAPCKKQLPAVRKLHERFGGHGLAVLGLSLDENAAAWSAAVRGLDLPWPQGRLGVGGAAGVSGVPAYWLLDPAGKIVAKADDPDELVKELEARLK